MRIAIVGSSGSGKTTLADRVVDRTGIHHIELDAIHHLPGWKMRPTDAMRSIVAEEVERPHWVCDGNYGSKGGDLVRAAADTIVVYDLPRHRVMRQLVARTIRRSVTREVLWNGNREPFTNFTSWDPERNVIRWSWVNHHEYGAKFAAARASGEWDHARVEVFTNQTQARHWVDNLRAP